LCAQCGESLEFDPASAEDALCRPCRVAPPDFRKAVAHGVYHDELRALLHLLKYDGMQPLASRLGALLAEPILAIPDLPADLLAVPVPLFQGKHRQRGFNQSELLARATLSALRLRRPHLRIEPAPRLLARQRATESQAGLSPHQRRANVRGAFFVPHPDAVRGRAVLLIDDIFTTGATARACSTALRRAGASAVLVATVARAQKERAFHSEAFHLQEAAAPELPMEQDVAYWNEDRTALTGGPQQEPSGLAIRTT
jgi:ComF family protein